MDKLTHEDYTSELKRGIFEVTFTKVNGDKRVMECTLHRRIVPQPTKTDPLTQTKVREVNTEVVSVWDINANGWRAFRVENVENFRKLGGVCGCGKSENKPYCDGSHAK